jgi:sulfate permease, SulP family
MERFGLHKWSFWFTFTAMWVEQISGCLVGVLVVAFQKVIYYLPNAVLSSIIIMSVSKLIDIEGAKVLWAQDKSDLAVMACSFFVTLLFGVQTGVLVAMLFSLLLFIWRSTRPGIIELGRIYGTEVCGPVGRHAAFVDWTCHIM